MKKNYESPMTEFVELDTQNVLLASGSKENYHNKENSQNSIDTPIDSVWD